MRKILVSILLGILFIFTTTGTGNLAAVQAVNTNVTNALAADTPIAIDENDDFETLGFPGEGTVEEPYIIEDLNFEVAVGYFQAGIKVQDTTDHFVIQNCTFRGVNKTEEPTYADFGIHLKNLANAVVKNCSFSELMYGVFILQCTYIVIEQNNFTGMLIEWFEYENMGCGICTGSIGELNERIVIGNNYMENCSQGILLMVIHDFDVYGNVIVKCGTGIIVEDQIDNGTLRQNTILNGTLAGIQCTRSGNVRILNNTFMYNKLYGIWLDEDADDNFVSLNLLKHNGDFSENTGSGIWVHSQSHRNNITMNDLLFNYENVVNDIVGTNYDLNYYSDYEGTDDDGDGIGEDPYLICGVANTSDLHPRVLMISQ
ncbi:MAG: right-handed parallel beta-helix repeat-containing protein, partial [Candidatus Thorarchaeota archaeon]|nr:right-handed parallel beta-helix repeat-containing protein [Candidatus Thorarchaeota archaeon]